MQGGLPCVLALVRHRNRAAEQTVRQWVYAPRIVNGKPVEAITETKVEFSLRHSLPRKTGSNPGHHCRYAR